MLAIDIGNTNVTLGVFQGATLASERRMRSDRRLTAADAGRELRRLLRGRRPFAVMASVVPGLDPVFRKALRSLNVPLWQVTARSVPRMALRVDRPSQVGADRLVNALAVHELFGGPAVVVDFGTATTFDCVSEEGHYLGGAILPGPLLAAKALALHTAKLPEVRLRKPRRIVGKNTIECIQAGLYHGYLGMIERVLRGTIREMPGPAAAVRRVATGGLVRLFLKDLPAGFRWVPDLTLQGLRLAFERRFSSKER